jgi:hypothetical protein
MEDFSTSLQDEYLDNRIKDAFEVLNVEANQGALV